MDRGPSSSWVLAAIAGCTALTSIALIYRQRTTQVDECFDERSLSLSSEEDSTLEPMEDDVSGEEHEMNKDAGLPQEQLIGHKDVTEPPEKACIPISSLGLPFFTFWAMVIISCIALILMSLDGDVSSPTEYTLYLPLMCVGIGILCFSLTQETDQPFFQQILVKKSQSNDQEASTFNADMGNKNADRISDQIPSKEINQKTLLKADELYDQKNHHEIYRILSLAAHSKNAEVLWRLARACYDLHEKAVNNVEKKRLVTEGLDFAQQAIHSDSNCAAAYKWMAIMMSAMGKFKSTKDKIAGAWAIHNYITKAIALDPNDATSRHILGQWCYALASMSWIEHRTASALFGSPPTSTHEEALAQFLAAESIAPGFWKKNMLCIAQSYEKLNNRAQAKVWLEKVKESTMTEEDQQILDDIEVLSNQLS